MSPFTRASPPAFAGALSSCWPFPPYQNPMVFPSVTPRLCQGYLYTSFPPRRDPSAACSCFFPYLALPSLFFPIFPPHTLSIPLLVFCPHAVFPCCAFLSPIIICLENKSCSMSTSQRRKGSTCSPLFFFFPTPFSWFPSKTVGPFCQNIPWCFEIVRFGSEKLLKQKCRHCCT